MIEKKVLRDMVEQTIRHFDFYKVKFVMKQLDWTYVDVNGDRYFPSVEGMMSDARSDLLELCEQFDGKELSMRCGGFEASIDADGTMELKFVLEYNESFYPGSERDIIENV